VSADASLLNGPHFLSVVDQYWMLRKAEIVPTRANSALIGPSEWKLPLNVTISLEREPAGQPEQLGGTQLPCSKSLPCQTLMVGAESGDG